MPVERIEVQQMSEEDDAKMRKLFDSFENYDQSFVRTNPGNSVLPVAYRKYKDSIKNFEVRPDDIFQLNYHKCGTNWMRELLTLLKNDFDFDKTQAIPLTQRGVMLDIPFLTDVLKKDDVPVDQMTELFAKTPSPRLVVSQIPICLLPDDLFDKCKVVICLRNPKDTVVSKYHFDKMAKHFGFVGNFAEYFDAFMADLVPYGSYFEYAKEAWEKRHHPNVCMLFFEEMKKDMASNLRKVATFLGKSFTDEQIEKSVGFLSFKEMKERGGHEEIHNLVRKEGNQGNIMRKGEVGDWKNYFTDEMNKRMNEAIEKHFKPIGLEFQYE